MKLVKVVLLIFSGIILFSCGSRKLPIVSITVNNVRLDVEVADEKQERDQGLMHRTELKEREGMLFVFDRDQTMSFWMKNTLIPLTIAYISSDGVIKELYDMEPGSLTPVTSKYRARYALELKQGAFQRLGISVGDVVVFPDNFLKQN